MTTNLEEAFPGLKDTAYLVTSPVDRSYNCIAWAAGDTSRWWWPDDENYWPPLGTRTESLPSIIEAFGTLGYEKCESIADDGKEYVAVFSSDDLHFLHAARRLQNGNWTSKLGQLVDIEHALNALQGRRYGRVVLLMARPRLPSA
jgi:hypothetical protein